MGKCVLSFDQIEIVNQKSDGRYSDNDWMVITWFVDDTVARTDKFPLLSLKGGVGLQSGDGITPFTSEVDCDDGDIVTAAYNVVNLGSTDLTDQPDAIAKIAENISESLAQAYLKAAEIYLKDFSDLPFSDLLAGEIDAFSPVIVNTIGAAFDNVIVPLLNDVIQQIQVIVGKPNCNGNVFYDMAVFKPGQPVPDITSSKTYTAASVTGCHSPAKTDVSTTLHRSLDVPLKFGDAAPAGLLFVPSESETGWLDVATEDSLILNPKVFVTIAPSKAASGLYAVTVTEQVDARLDAVFTASADPVSVQTLHVRPFVNNIYGTVRPWTSRPLRPNDLMATALGISASAGIAGEKGRITQKSVRTKPTAMTQSNVEAPATKYVFTLGWQKPPLPGPYPTVPVGYPRAIAGVSSTSSAVDFLETVNVLQILSRGVTICLYELQTPGGDRIGYAQRYIRDQNMTYTGADLRLVKWDPAK